MGTRIKQLCLLAMLLMLFASCNRMVHTDYKSMDYGIIEALDEENNAVDVRSFRDIKTTWYIKNPQKDYFKKGENFAVGDTIYIYHDKGSMFASKHSIDDAKNINKALSNYFWQNLAQNWYWLLLINLIITAFILEWIHSEGGVVLAVIIGGFCTLLLLGTGKRLTPESEGTITEINARQNYVMLNDSLKVSITTPIDITTREPVLVGQQVTSYRYALPCNANGKSFLSSQKLNERTLNTSQVYPEIWFMGLIVFWIGVLLTQYFIGLAYELWHKVRKKK